VTLPNYPRFARFRDATPLPAAIDRSAVPGVAGRLKLIYIGSLTRNRGVDLMLDVLRQVPEVELYLGGTFSNPELETEVAAAADRDLRGRLHLLGRVPPADVPGWLACADVAWVPARKTTQYARPTVATKLFEGMAAGLAVLVSDLPGRGEVVRTEECGLVVEPTVQGHLEGVRRLVADGASVQAMGERARAAVEARYSWEVIESRLVDFYAELLARCRGTRR
jgi:glycosyltransferase involved in cell wall biosynthesis